MFADIDKLVEFLNSNAHGEGRAHEFKKGASWDSLKSKVVKGALGLANLSGGGYVIIGVSENKTTPMYDFDGMSDEDFKTYNPDDVISYINSFADPHMDVELGKFSDGSRNFVVIRVSEFDYEPVISKKDHGDDVIHGRIYCRRHRMPESSPTPSITELREIIELVVDKGIKRQIRRLRSYGGSVSFEPFEKERGVF